MGPPSEPDHEEPTPPPSTDDFETPLSPPHVRLPVPSESTIDPEVDHELVVLITVPDGGLEAEATFSRSMLPAPAGGASEAVHSVHVTLTGSSLPGGDIMARLGVDRRTPASDTPTRFYVGEPAWGQPGEGTLSFTFQLPRTASTHERISGNALNMEEANEPLLPLRNDHRTNSFFFCLCLDGPARPADAADQPPQYRLDLEALDPQPLPPPLAASTTGPSLEEHKVDIEKAPVSAKKTVGGGAKDPPAVLNPYAYREVADNCCVIPCVCYEYVPYKTRWPSAWQLLKGTFRFIRWTVSFCFFLLTLLSYPLWVIYFSCKKGGRGDRTAWQLACQPFAGYPALPNFALCCRDRPRLPPLTPLQRAFLLWLRLSKKIQKKRLKFQAFWFAFVVFSLGTVVAPVIDSQVCTETEVEGLERSAVRSLVRDQLLPNISSLTSITNSIAFVDMVTDLLADGEGANETLVRAEGTRFIYECHIAMTWLTTLLPAAVLVLGVILAATNLRGRWNQLIQQRSMLQRTIFEYRTGTLRVLKAQRESKTERYSGPAKRVHVSPIVGGASLDLPAEEPSDEGVDPAEQAAKAAAMSKAHASAEVAAAAALVAAAQARAAAAAGIDLTAGVAGLYLKAVVTAATKAGAAAADAAAAGREALGAALPVVAAEVVVANARAAGEVERDGAAERTADQLLTDTVEEIRMRAGFSMRSLTTSLPEAYEEDHPWHQHKGTDGPFPLPPLPKTFTEGGIYHLDYLGLSSEDWHFDNTGARAEPKEAPVVILEPGVVAPDGSPGTPAVGTGDDEAVLQMLCGIKDTETYYKLRVVAFRHHLYRHEILLVVLDTIFRALAVILSVASIYVGSEFPAWLPVVGGSAAAVAAFIALYQVETRRRDISELRELLTDAHADAQSNSSRADLVELVDSVEAAIADFADAWTETVPAKFTWKNYHKTGKKQKKE